jgi:hypothetical protein
MDSVYVILFLMRQSVAANPAPATA